MSQFDPLNHNELAVTETVIPGFYEIDLPVHGDNRGWFKENYQKEKMEALGLPTFNIVQNNVSFNETKGVTRGLHAEPWDKFISVFFGRVFGAWVDLREGPTFGQTLTIELNPGKAVYVPSGVANGFQTLDDNVVYSYLVNEHWSLEAKAKYTFVNFADPELGIDWPLEPTEVSEDDRNHPFLSDVTPMEV